MSRNVSRFYAWQVQSLQSSRPRGYKTTMAANQNVFAFLVGLRVLGKTPYLYSRFSLKFYILCTLLVGVRPRHRSKLSSQTWLLSFFVCSAYGILQVIKRNIYTRRRHWISRFSTRIQTCRQRRGESGTAHALLNNIYRGVLETRMNPDTCGPGDSIRIRVCVDAETFKSGKKSLRIQKCPDWEWRHRNITWQCPIKNTWKKWNVFDAVVCFLCFTATTHCKKIIVAVG